MNAFQVSLMNALSHLYPDGFEGFDLSKPNPPDSFEVYQTSLKSGFTPLTEQEITDAAAGWDAAAPQRERSRMALTIPQFRKVLIKHNVTIGGQTVSLKTAVESAIAAVQNPDLKIDLEVWYEDPPALIRRTAEKVEAIRSALGITPESADSIWQTGMSYE